MRLLEIGKNGELRFTRRFAGGNVPQYAILSHTWGPEDEEVVFKDVEDGTGMNKAGYNKIRFCADQASRDGLKYFWIDSCCIDKSDSVELSEAINSMFRWYSNAARCYVYLSDVSIASPKEDNKFPPPYNRVRDFETSW
ncbi:heterokaryon incompatibility protein domain-containing protein [Trichoderma longibrachiatum]